MPPEPKSYAAKPTRRCCSDAGKFRPAGEWGLPDYLCLMLTDQDYLKDYFAVRTETALKNLEKVSRVLGDNVDILGLEAFDFGSQKPN